MAILSITAEKGENKLNSIEQQIANLTQRFMLIKYICMLYTNHFTLRQSYPTIQDV